MVTSAASIILQGFHRSYVNSGKITRNSAPNHRLWGTAIHVFFPFVGNPSFTTSNYRWNVSKWIRRWIYALTPHWSHFHNNHFWWSVTIFIWHSLESALGSNLNVLRILHSAAQNENHWASVFQSYGLICVTDSFSSYLDFTRVPSRFGKHYRCASERLIWFFCSLTSETLRFQNHWLKG